MEVSFAVDLDELDHVVGRLSSFERLLEARLAELDATVATLQPAFTGAAATAQRARHGGGRRSRSISTPRRPPWRPRLVKPGGG
jgi:hypothetical protein